MYKRPNNLARRRKNWQILTDCCEKKIKESSGDNNGIILTVSRKVAKILLIESRKSYHLVETLWQGISGLSWAWIDLVRSVCGV